MPFVGWKDDRYVLNIQLNVLMISLQAAKWQRLRMLNTSERRKLAMTVWNMRNKRSVLEMLN